ncbi:MAG: hypothetical protein JWR44_1306 [Hymenobacter sp.]|jgi:hypothetical protein|nr:hypothetical protein [Hymenobacter sp.]
MPHLMAAVVRRFPPRPLLGILLLALLLRAAFLLVGAPVFYHSPHQFYFNGDSTSYIQAFENLWLTGRYTFDFLEPGAAFGRLPGYPFFYGIHRIVFGAALAPAATAWSQVLLDTGAVWLVYGIIKCLAPAQWPAAYWGALLYATYPFIILWVPIVGTEALSTDLTLLWLFVAVSGRPSTPRALGLGAVAALGLLVREYMGILLPITVLWVVTCEWGENPRLALRYGALVILGFGLMYGGWPLRNYALTHKLILLKPRAAGYANQTSDVDEFYQWVHCWTPDENPWLDSVLVGRGEVRFPATAFTAPGDEALAQALVAQARRCGSGFYVLRSGIAISAKYQDTAAVLADTTFQRYHFRNCNAAIGAGFRDLRQRFAERQPLRFWFDVPLQNLKKAFFKNTITPEQAVQRRTRPAATPWLALLFAYRTALLLLGWVGLLVGLRRRFGLWLVLAVSGFQYLYICFVYRGLEMRYLLQADVLLLIPAALVLGWAHQQLRSKASTPAARA